MNPITLISNTPKKHGPNDAEIQQKNMVLFMGCFIWRGVGQWPCQEPIEDGGTYHRKKAYFSGRVLVNIPTKYGQTYGTIPP